jgi:hypothetical protein
MFGYCNVETTNRHTSREEAKLFLQSRSKLDEICANFQQSLVHVGGGGCASSKYGTWAAAAVVSCGLAAHPSAKRPHPAARRPHPHRFRSYPAEEAFILNNKYGRKSCIMFLWALPGSTVTSTLLYSPLPPSRKKHVYFCYKKPAVQNAKK